MTRKIVTVIWGDAHSNLDEMTLDEIRGGTHTNVIHTMGYVVNETPEMIVIAGEWLPARQGGDETFRNVTFIPKPWIIQQVKRRGKPSQSPTSVPPVTAESSTA